jgi:hypothetical protein
MPETSIVESCYRALAQTVELLRTDERSAREFFNASVYPKYAEAVSNDASPLRSFFFFFAQLDEYLNNPAFRALGQGRAEDIIGSFESDFQDDYREAREKERSARGDGRSAGNSGKR